MLVRAGRGTRAGGYFTLMYMLQQFLLWLLDWQIDSSTNDSVLITCGLYILTYKHASTSSGNYKFKNGNATTVDPLPSWNQGNVKARILNFVKNATSKISFLNALERNPFVKVDDNNFDNNYIDAYSLFAFANNVGALIVYAMLESMNPDNLRHISKGVDKDQFVQDKISNAIAPREYSGNSARLNL